MSDIAKDILSRIKKDAQVPGAHFKIQTTLTTDSAVGRNPKVRRAVATRPMSPATSRALKAIGSGVKKARQARRLTQEDLAKRAGIARKTLVSIEAGAGSAAMGAFIEVLTVLDEDILSGIVDTLRADPTGKRLLEGRMPELVVRRKRQPKVGATKMLSYRKPR